MSQRAHNTDVFRLGPAAAGAAEYVRSTILSLASFLLLLSIIILLPLLLGLISGLRISH